MTGQEEPTPHGERVYYEPARPYTTVWLLLLALIAGFLIDIALGGAVAHLPGWIIAAVLILGIDVLIVRAARSTRSLLVTTDELWVGDEMINRPEIVGLTPGIDDELPVLGWPTGMPRTIRGVTLRLVDEHDVVVPTRKPDRLRSALDVGPAEPKTPAEVRPATEAELALLADIDERAEIVFRLAGYVLPEIGFPDDLDDAMAIFVVEDPPVGFVLITEVDALAHVEETAVVPGAMQKGLGTRLLERACEWARAEGYAAITLITYADVPWNGPWYASRGFAETDQVTPGLAALREREQALGLDDVGRRIVMRRELEP